MSAARLRFVLVLSVLLLAAEPGAGQEPCDRTLEPVAGPLGYSRRPDRCEGLYVALRHSFFELVGLTWGRPWMNDPPPGDGATARVTPGPGAAARVLSLRIVQLDAAGNYRLDARIPADSGFEWPTTDVLKEAGISLNDLGILSWYEDRQGRHYVPVAVGSAPRRGSAWLLLRSPLQPDAAWWRVTRAGGPAGAWKKIDEAALPKQEPYLIAIPLPDAGSWIIDARGKAVNRDEQMSLTIRVSR